MALLDFSEVTLSLIELLRQAFGSSPAWTAMMGPPNIVPEPPARLNNEGVGVYLYHVLEKKEYGNFPASGNDSPPVRFLPTALTLYYQVSANSPMNENAGSGSINEQLMMSIAIKAFHDYPCLDDQSTISGAPFFPAGMLGKENRIKISPLPVSYSDAVHNWTAGSAPMKLSAYYEVSIVFLEPEETTSYSSRVLTYGNFIFAGGAPFILSGQSILNFVLPGSAIVREVKVQPGQAAPGKTISLFGSGFNADEMGLKILPPGAKEVLLADAAWKVTVNATNKITFTVQSTAIKEKDGTVAQLLPGIYSVQVLATRFLKLPNGEVRKLTNSSNQFPFIISPSITIGAIVGNKVAVTGFTFQDPTIIDIYLGADKLVLNAGGVFNPKEYRINSATSLDIALPLPLITGQAFPVRMVIGGTESAPVWVITP